MPAKFLTRTISENSYRRVKLTYDLQWIKNGTNTSLEDIIVCILILITCLITVENYYLHEMTYPRITWGQCGSRFHNIRW